MGAPLDLVAIGPVADDAEARVHATRAERRERAHDVVGAFDARHPPDPADGESARRDPHHAARLGRISSSIAPLSSSIPSRTTVNFSAGATWQGSLYKIKAAIPGNTTITGINNLRKEQIKARCVPF